VIFRVLSISLCMTRTPNRKKVDIPIWFAGS
jgi:hypothetical protein